MKAAQMAASPDRQKRYHSIVKIAVWLIGMMALCISLMLSISVGAAEIDLATVWEALVDFDANQTQHQIVRNLRAPRALVGVLVGMGLAVAGAIMQGLTRNPLASPSIMGVNAGAGLALAVIYAFTPGIAYSKQILFSFLGAAVGVGVVFMISSLSQEGMTPVRLSLAGMTVSTLFGSVATGISIYFQTGQELTYWLAGGITGSTWEQVRILLPWISVGVIGSFLLSRSITVLNLGEETSRGLGQRTKMVKFGGSCLVFILAGAAVSAAGPVGFVGLIIPHIARFFVGLDYRWIIPYSTLLGGLFFVLADIGARVFHPPYETPIGVLTAMLGVPFFLYLARWKQKEGEWQR